ncbi:hypothetical protein D3C87_1686080 [compost metagenome]
MAVEEVILRLLHLRTFQSQTLSHCMCFHNLYPTPFAGTPVEDFTLLYECIHRAHDFFNRHMLIGAVAEIQIQVVDL